MRFAWIATLLACAGCNSTLDKKHFERDLSYYDAVDKYAGAGAEILVKGLAFERDQHLIWQKAHDDDWFNGFLSSHTKDGRLVSLDAAGKEVPLSVADLTLALDHKNESAMKLAQARHDSQAFLDHFVAATEEMKVMNAMARQGTLDTQEAKARGQAITEHILSGLGAFVGGAAMGMGL